MKTQRLWTLAEDMNFDGTVTYRDVLLWVKWLFFYPGDGFLYFIINKTPDVAGFFEITELSYSGFLSGLISLLFWLFLIGCYAAIKVGIEEARQKKERHRREMEIVREEIEDARKRQEAYKHRAED
jgi:hypothetical protein